MEEGQAKDESQITIDEPINKDIKNKANKGVLASIIILSILTIGSISFGIYELMQNNNNSAEIETLKAQLADKIKNVETDNNNENTLLEITTNEQDNPEETPETSTSTNDQNEINPGEIAGKYILLNKKLSSAREQRYELIYISGGDRTAFNNISSEDDSYYILDTQKLGSTEDLKAFDLVSVIKPLTEQKIKNGMPEYANFNIYSNDDKLYLSQCESFTVEYLDGNNYLPMTIGFNLNTDIPIAVNFNCHYNNDTTRRLYHRAIYNLNAETGAIKEIEQYSTSDFTHQ